MFTKSTFVSSVLIIAAAAFLILGCEKDTNSSISSAPTLTTTSLDKAISMRFPIEFVLPDQGGENCSLGTTIIGEGIGHFVLRLSKTGDPVGFTFNAAEGTAVGEDGSTYVWNDAASASKFQDGFFNEGWSFNMVDHFNLIGKGKTMKLRAYVNGRLTQNADGEFVPDVNTTVRGEECDPDLPLSN
jgi:hypothetical protein